MGTRETKVPNARRSKTENRQSEPRVSDEGKACAALAYIFPVGLVWYLADSKIRRDPFARFHVHQSLAAAIVALGGWIIGSVLTVILVGVVLLVATAVVGVIWLVQGLFNALSGKEEELWAVGKFGRRFDF